MPERASHEGRGSNAVPFVCGLVAAGGKVAGGKARAGGLGGAKPLRLGAPVPGPPGPPRPPGTRRGGASRGAVAGGGWGQGAGRWPVRREAAAHVNACAGTSGTSETSGSAPGRCFARAGGRRCLEARRGPLATNLQLPPPYGRIIASVEEPGT